MKKTLICLLAMPLLLTSCGEDTQKNRKVNSNVSGVDNTIRTVNVNTVELFDYYFSVSTTNTFSFKYKNQVLDESQSKYIRYYTVNSTNTINVNARLDGFVEYSGNVTLKAVTSEEKDASLKKDRSIKINTWGNVSDCMEIDTTIDEDVESFTFSFEDISFKAKSVDIVLIYHNEGLSGNKDLTYTSVEINSYNYIGYLDYSISVGYDSMYNENNSITGYNYYFTITIKPDTAVSSYVEFNHGIEVKVTASGNATYITSKTPIDKDKVTSLSPFSFDGISEIRPSLLSVSGSIDLYPGPTLMYL